MTIALNSAAGTAPEIAQPAEAGATAVPQRPMYRIQCARMEYASRGPEHNEYPVGYFVLPGDALLRQVIEGVNYEQKTPGMPLGLYYKEVKLPPTATIKTCFEEDFDPLLTVSFWRYIPARSTADPTPINFAISIGRLIFDAIGQTASDVKGPGRMDRESITTFTYPRGTLPTADNEEAQAGVLGKLIDALPMIRWIHDPENAEESVRYGYALNDERRLNGVEAVLIRGGYALFSLRLEGGDKIVATCVPDAIYIENGALNPNVTIRSLGGEVVDLRHIKPTRVDTEFLYHGKPLNVLDGARIIDRRELDEIRRGTEPKELTAVSI